MKKLIGRSSNLQDRFFPAVGPSLCRPIDSCQTAQDSEVQAIPTHAESSATAVLELANRTFTRWQLWTGRGLDAEGQLARLLWLHRSVLDDEINGRWQRADFYWREIIKTLRQMQKRSEVWEHLDEHFAFKVNYHSKNHSGLRYRVIAELLIDTNCALFNGRLQQSETTMPGDRAFVYAANLRELLTLAGMEEAERWLIAEQLADIQLSAHREQSQIQQALKICEDMACEFPGRWKYQDLMVEIEIQSALAELSKSEDRSTNLKDAQRLGMAVDALERLSKTYPYNLQIYESLGLLNQVRSVKLANGGELSQALLAIEESLAYEPGSKQAEEIRNQLRESMRTLKAQVAMVEVEIASRPGSMLNEEGNRLKNEAKKGWESADRFIGSGRAATLSKAAQHARAVRFWQLVGLGGSDNQIAASAMKLYEVLPSLFDGSSMNPDALRTRLVEVTGDIPEIDALRRDLLLRYLEKHLFHADAPEEVIPAQSADDPPVLIPQKMSEAPSKEPAGMWLFSREGLSVKVLAATALAVMLISGAMAGWDQYKRNLRDRAYIELLNAVHSGAEKGVLHAADEFLSAPGFKADARRAQVQALQEQARMAIKSPQTRAVYEALIEAVRLESIEQIEVLAERFRALTADTPNDPRLPHVKQVWEQARVIAERAKRDEAYERLVLAVAQQDLGAAIAAAEAFLAMPQTYSKDPRTDQVKRIRDQAQELPNQRLRDAAYKDLLAAINAEDPELVMIAAEVFLSSAPIQVADERRKQVIDAYSSAFVSWFIAVVDPNVASAKQRIKTYSDLIADKGKGN